MNLTGSEQLAFPWASFQQALRAPLAQAPALPVLPRQYRLRLINVAQAGMPDYRPREVYATLAEATSAANETNDGSANWRAEIEEV